MAACMLPLTVCCTYIKGVQHQTVGLILLVYVQVMESWLLHYHVNLSSGAQHYICL